ncbi:MAG: hypothetical protein ACKPKO_05090 [Candidatus Fonsibacter sp.]
MLDLSGAINPNWDGIPTVQRYRNLGDIVSMFDTKAHSTLYGTFFDNPTLTHPYANNAKK